jgi:hypothetical protein
VDAEEPLRLGFDEYFAEAYQMGHLGTGSGSNIYRIFMKIFFLKKGPKPAPRILTIIESAFEA